MTTRITFIVLVLLGLVTGTLNVLGYPTITDRVRSAVEHTPALIGLGALGSAMLARRMWRRREWLGWLAILLVGWVCGHWFWWV